MQETSRTNSTKHFKDEGHSPKIKDCSSDSRRVGAYVASQERADLMEGPAKSLAWARQ